MNQKLIQNSIVIAILILFVFCVRWGFLAGRDIARTKITLSNVSSLQRGLGYFYDDQNRYPSLSEFASLEPMNVYFTNFPPRSFAYKDCSPNYNYNTFRQLSFELDFCIPRSSGTVPKGKSQINEKDSLVGGK